MKLDILNEQDTLAQQEAEARLKTLTYKFLKTPIDDDAHNNSKLYLLDYEHASSIVTLEKIAFCSLCEHHLVPFFGHIYLSYIPSKQILGLSQFSTIISQRSRQLTLQEKLGSDLVEYFERLLTPKAILLKIIAFHSCVAMKDPQRGPIPLTTLHFLGEQVHQSCLDQTLRGFNV